MHTLNILEDGVMAYIEIPKIHVNLPIYHGVSEDVLAKGAGHIEGTSLPIGGKIVILSFVPTEDYQAQNYFQIKMN